MQFANGNAGLAMIARRSVMPENAIAAIANRLGYPLCLLSQRFDTAIGMQVQQVLNGRTKFANILIFPVVIAIAIVPVANIAIAWQADSLSP